ncbi:MAG: hypothetical protein P8X57_05680 [Cyclobacteriaceae bacterium]
MKFKQIVPFIVVLSFLSFTNGYSQDNPLEKGEVLSAMNSFDGLDLSSDKQDRLKEANQSAVDRVLDIARSGDSEEEKMRLFKNAREENKKLFENILDEKEFKKYKKSVKKKLKPFKRRAKLVGFLL